MWSGSRTNRKEQKCENSQILKDRYMRPCMKRHFFFKRLRTNQNSTKLLRARYNLSGDDCWHPLKLFSYLLFSTVYLTFE